AVIFANQRKPSAFFLPAGTEIIRQPLGPRSFPKFYTRLTADKQKNGRKKLFHCYYLRFCTHALIECALARFY
ncbi:MAG TPA: hypothetical protein VH597_00005, partial [Verrucomicrobiae bacterium]|nr:hypothetical protein [Verrucomicrobiae bacterium]